MKGVIGKSDAKQENKQMPSVGWKKNIFELRLQVTAGYTAEAAKRWGWQASSWQVTQVKTADSGNNQAAMQMTKKNSRTGSGTRRTSSVALEDGFAGRRTMNQARLNLGKTVIYRITVRIVTILHLTLLRGTRCIPIYNFSNSFSQYYKSKSSPMSMSIKSFDNVSVLFCTSTSFLDLSVPP